MNLVAGQCWNQRTQMVSSGMNRLLIGRYSNFLWKCIYMLLYRYNIQSILFYIFLQKTIIRLRQYNNDILVALWVGPDIQDSDEHIVQVSVGVWNFRRYLSSKEYLFNLHDLLTIFHHPNIVFSTVWPKPTDACKRRVLSIRIKSSHHANLLQYIG